MALTELQLPTKADFYNNLQGSAGELIRVMVRYELLTSFLGKLETADWDAMGIPTGQVRVDILNFKNTVDDFVNLWHNNAVTPANAPQDITDEIRRMTIF